MSQKPGQEIPTGLEASLFKQLSDVDSLIDKAGEWEVSITGEIPVSRLSQEMDTFLGTFPWLNPRKLTVAIAGAPAFFTWEATTSPFPLQQWLATLVAEGEIFNGLEGTFDAEVSWPSPNQQLKRVTLPKAVELILDTFHPENPFYSLSIWPNVFTDLIYDHDQPEDPESGLALRSFGAAKANRAALRASLQQWEATTGGRISGWDSDVVEGVEPYGFSEDAQVR